MHGRCNAHRHEMNLKLDELHFCKVKHSANAYRCRGYLGGLVFPALIKSMTAPVRVEYLLCYPQKSTD
jgi:hypothetical protein